MERRVRNKRGRRGGGGGRFYISLRPLRFPVIPSTGHRDRMSENFFIGMLYACRYRDGETCAWMHTELRKKNGGIKYLRVTRASIRGLVDDVKT